MGGPWVTTTLPTGGSSPPDPPPLASSSPLSSSSPLPLVLPDSLKVAVARLATSEGAAAVLLGVPTTV